MEPETWKALAIIFIILFIVETGVMLWVYNLGIQEDKKTKTCLYDICSEYPEADYSDDVCYCYDYDMFGDYIIVKTEYMKW